MANTPLAHASPGLRVSVGRGHLRVLLGNQDFTLKKIIPHFHLEL